MFCQRHCLYLQSLGSMQINAQETKNESQNQTGCLLKNLKVPWLANRLKHILLLILEMYRMFNGKGSVNFDEAVFTKNGKTMTAWYDFYENLVGTTSKASFADLPAEGQKAIKTRYKDYTMWEQSFFLMIMK